jgi:DNA-binding Xre family transcriptional regulator
MADERSANRNGAEGPRGNRAASGSPAAVRGGRPAWTVKAERLDQERILQGLSQERLARVAHVDPGTLSDTLCKKRRPTLGTLSALCRALGLHLGDVIAFDG